MGLLSGKFDANSRVPTNDVRGSGHKWVDYFDDGRARPEFLEALAGIREVLTSGGRTSAQGAISWIWARSVHTVPIPGFKTVEQVEENAGAMRLGGPPSNSEMDEIERLVPTSMR